MVTVVNRTPRAAYVVASVALTLGLCGLGMQAASAEVLPDSSGTSAAPEAPVSPITLKSADYEVDSTKLIVTFEAGGNDVATDEAIAITLDGKLIETVPLDEGAVKSYERTYTVAGPRTLTLGLTGTWKSGDESLSEKLWSETVQVPATPKPTTTRISGADRYEAAVNVSKAAYPETAPVVYVVTGANYPDALSAGPAPGSEGGPLLLTTTESLLPAVAAEIKRLQPDKIVVVGGPNSVSPKVLSTLEGLQSNTVRISGADRYEASQNLAKYAFGTTGAATAYVATGANFPDALSAGAAAASTDGPVVLVNGDATAPDAATLALLNDLEVETVKIAGGPASVSLGVEAGLANDDRSVARFGGADRFEASATINADAFASSTEAFLVTGLKFPDALSGSAWAGAINAPLYVTLPDCVPSETLAAMRAQGVTDVTLIGGPASLSQKVLDLTSCD